MNKRNIFNRIAHGSLSYAFQSLNRLLCASGLMRPKVIIYVDGGICSQMHMYLLGAYYKDAPVDVMYDALWFAENGKDMDGKFDRKLELTELFPRLPFITVTKRQRKFYRFCFLNQKQDHLLPAPESIRQNIYLGGYYHLFPTEDFKKLFTSCFNRDAMCALPFHIPSHENGTNCAVHIRRGDLANRDEQFYQENPWYQKISVEYFLNTMNYVMAHYPNVRFFFFSDELDWVETNLCTKISAPYQLIRGNKAYVDLALISECDVVIGSQGSFGKTGARLNGYSDVLVPSADSELGFKIKNFSKEVF